MFHLTIAAIDHVLFEGSVRSLNCPGSAGEMTILAHHAPLVSTLKEGVLRIEEESGKKEFFISKGVLAVHKKETIVLVS